MVARWCVSSSGVFAPPLPQRAPAPRPPRTRLTHAHTRPTHAHTFFTPTTHALALWTAANLCTADGCNCTAAEPGGPLCTCAASGHKHVKSSSAAGASAVSGVFAPALFAPARAPPLLMPHALTFSTPTRTPSLSGLQARLAVRQQQRASGVFAPALFAPARAPPLLMPHAPPPQRAPANATAPRPPRTRLTHAHTRAHFFHAHNARPRSLDCRHQARHRGLCHCEGPRP